MKLASPLQLKMVFLLNAESLSSYTEVTPWL